MKDLKALKDQYKKLGDEIERLEKEDKNEWVLYSKTGRVGFFLFPKDRSFEGLSDLYDTIEPVTAESLARFLTKKATRYDWSKIVKEYPRAVYATTDSDGRLDVWDKIPVFSKIDGRWKEQISGECLSRGPAVIIDRPYNAEETLEKRPDYI